MEIPPKASEPGAYRTSPGWLALLLGLGAIFVIAGLAGLSFFSRQVDQRLPATLVVIISFGFMFALGASCIWGVVRDRVLVFPEHIEVRSFLRTRTLSRDQIAGWKIDPNPRDPRLVLVAKDSTVQPVKIASTIKLDEAFFEWLGDMPDLDESEKEQALAEISNDANLGATPEARLSALEKGKHTARLIDVVGLVLGLWALISSRPSALLIATLICLPLLAVAFVGRSKGAVKLGKYRNDPQPAVAAAIVLPAIALAFRTLTRIYVVSWINAAWLTLGVAAIFWWLAIKADPKLMIRRSVGFVFTAFALIYGYGAGVQANAFLDRSAPTTYEATISGKFVSHSRRNTSYQLWIDPWAVKKRKSTIAVTPGVYQSVARGDSVFFALKRGAFGVAWYEVQSYRQPSAPTQ